FGHKQHRRCANCLAGPGPRHRATPDRGIDAIDILVKQHPDAIILTESYDGKTAGRRRATGLPNEKGYPFYAADDRRHIDPYEVGISVGRTRGRRFVPR